MWSYLLLPGAACAAACCCQEWSREPKVTQSGRRVWRIERDWWVCGGGLESLGRDGRSEEELVGLWGGLAGWGGMVRGDKNSPVWFGEVETVKSPGLSKQLSLPTPGFVL